MAWRIAKSLETLRAQINAHYPKRSKVSDGTIGDAAHSSRTSDHNPDSKGRVCAFDITEDFKNGPDLPKLLPLLLRDSRTKYIIYEGKIYNPTIQNGAARPYTGVNAHKQHLHLSVTQAGADDVREWALPGAAVSSAPPNPAPEPTKPRQTLKKGMTGGDVPVLQLRLKELGDYKGLVDGDFGPKTEAAVKAIQARTGLKADGVVGPLTWAKLAVAPPVAPEQTKNGPKEAIKLFESLGWSKIQATALVANLIWESGGNQDNPDTIRFEAVGDTGNSIGAGQWNKAFGRQQMLLDFAAKKGKTWKDPETQLLYLDHELHTTERKAGVALRAATTIEDAVAASILIWRPGTPHADKRLAIAKTLMAA
jgi:peptidoglycan hydrolase-like protein with peptidoglycan-binding domain